MFPAIAYIRRGFRSILLNATRRTMHVTLQHVEDNKDNLLFYLVREARQLLSALGRFMFFPRLLQVKAHCL